MTEILIKRVKAFTVDYLIMIIIAIILFEISTDIFLSMFIVYPLAMNKDFLNGKSIGKRLFGIQVQNLSKTKPNELQSVIRNFLPIIPIDFIITIFSPSRRIGDIIAKTKIGFENDLNIKTIKSELKQYKISTDLIIAILFSLLNIYGLSMFYSFILK